jgi:hypothetical protein
MPVAFKKWLESLWCISSFDSHLSTYGNLFLVVLDSCFWCSLFMGVWVVDGSIICDSWQLACQVRSCVGNVYVDCGGGFVFPHTLVS